MLRYSHGFADAQLASLAGVVVAARQIVDTIHASTMIATAAPKIAHASAARSNFVFGARRLDVWSSSIMG